MISFTESEAEDKPFRRACVTGAFWLLGRAFAAAAAVDDAVRETIDRLPPRFTFVVDVWPGDIALALGKDEGGRLRYLGTTAGDRRPALRLTLKHLDAAFRLLTLRESLADVAVRGRVVVSGEIASAMAVSRALETVLVYLLPKALARRTLKRYPDWPLENRLRGAFLIYVNVLSGA